MSCRVVVSCPAFPRCPIDLSLWPALQSNTYCDKKSRRELDRNRFSPKIQISARKPFTGTGASRESPVPVKGVQDPSYLHMSFFVQEHTSTEKSWESMSQDAYAQANCRHALEQCLDQSTRMLCSSSYGSDTCSILCCDAEPSAHVYKEELGIQAHRFVVCFVTEPSAHVHAL